MAYIHKLVQNAATLVDFLDSTKQKLVKWQRAAYAETQTVEDEILLHVLGASPDALAVNLTTLEQTIQTIKTNKDLAERALYYVPVWLQFQLNGGTYTLQSEVLDADENAFSDVLHVALNQNYLLNAPFRFKRRPYFEETSQQSLYTTPAIDNNGSGVALSGARGGLFMPLYIKNRTTLASQDRLIVGLKTIGSTLANFVCRYEAENNNGTGSNISNITPGTFSGSAGRRWTPGGAANDQRLLLWYITANVVDQMGTYRVFARVRDNAATPKVAIRARAGNYDGSNVVWGQYPRDGMSFYCVTANGTIELVDCGVLTLPAVDTQSVTPYGFAIELRGMADSSPSTFDVDCLYLLPAEGFATKSGMCIATMPSAAGTNALPDLVIDANDRKPRGYLETTAGALLSPASDLRGSALFLKPNTGARLFVLTQKSGDGSHDHTGSNTLTVTGTARYALARGS